MNDDDVLRQIQPIFREVFDDDSLIITGATCAEDIEDWDSLAQINLVVGIEKKLNLKFSLAELQGLESVGDMVQLIISKVDP